jgi:hypothetical protein
MKNLIAKRFAHSRELLPCLPFVSIQSPFYRRHAAACKSKKAVLPEKWHRGGNRFVVRADEKLTAFLELEAATRKKMS